MKAIPAKPITVVSSNIPNGSQAYTEWSAGSATINDIVKVTMGSDGKFIGVVFKSLIDNNTLDPILAKPTEWKPIAYLDFDDTRTYGKNEVVSMSGLNKVFISSEDSNDTRPDANDSKWLFLFMTNEYAGMDYYFTTTTEVYNQDLVMVLEFTKADSLSLFGVYGNEMLIEELDRDNGDAVMKASTITRVNTDSIVDFPTYLQFTGCEQINFHHQEIIPMDIHKIRITLSPLFFKQYNAAIAEISTIVAGLSMQLGCTLYGLNIQRIAITPPAYDKWGNMVLVGNDHVKQINATMVFDTSELDRMDTSIYRLFNAPAVYVLDDDGHYGALTTFGIMETNQITVNDGNSEVPMRIKSFKYKKNLKEC